MGKNEKRARSEQHEETLDRTGDSILTRFVQATAHAQARNRGAEPAEPETKPTVDSDADVEEREQQRVQLARRRMGMAVDAARVRIARSWERANPETFSPATFTPEEKARVDAHLDTLPPTTRAFFNRLHPNYRIAMMMVWAGMPIPTPSAPAVPPPAPASVEIGTRDTPSANPRRISNAQMAAWRANKSSAVDALLDRIHEKVMAASELSASNRIEISISEDEMRAIPGMETASNRSLLDFVRKVQNMFPADRQFDLLTCIFADSTILHTVDSAWFALRITLEFAE